MLYFALIHCHNPLNLHDTDSPADYDPMTNKRLNINTGDTRIVHNVKIIDDERAAETEISVSSAVVVAFGDFCNILFDAIWTASQS